MYDEVLSKVLEMTKFHCFSLDVSKNNHPSPSAKIKMKVLIFYIISKKAKQKWKCWYFKWSAKKRQNRSESDDLLYHQNNKGEKHKFHFHLFSSILKRLNWWISSVKNKWSSEPLVFFFTAGFAGSFSKTQPLDVLNRWMFISVVQVLVTAIIHLKVIIIQDDGSRFEIKCALLLLFFVYSALFSLVHISW